MPIDPTTGRIISTSNLSLKDTDELQIPRNSQIGPSRTAQNRKQLRTAFYQNVLASRSEFANAIANNPTIISLIEDSEFFDAFLPRTIAYSAGNMGPFQQVTLPRVENEADAPLYYGIQGQFLLVVSDADTAGIEINFLGTINYHNVVVRTETAATNGPVTDASVNYYTSSGTGETIIAAAPTNNEGTTFVYVTVTGTVVSFSESGVAGFNIVTTGTSPTISNTSNGSITFQLTNQAFVAP